VVGFYLAIAAILAFDGLLLAVLAWAYHSPRFAARRLSDRPSIKVPLGKRLKTMGVISTLSLAAVALPLWLVPQVFVGEAAPAWRVGLEALGILVIYDFVYYALHRGLHHKRAMRFVHGVHHRARNPSALESFYLHPAELLAGLGLLFFSTWVVGPVDPRAFLVAFFVYSTLNIVIHAGITLPRVLAPLTFLIRKHHVHHQNDFSKNYSSLTPLPDLIFRTAG